MFYRKLNKQFVIDHYQKTGSKIEYGIDTPMGFMGIKYSYIMTPNDEELYRVVPNRDRDNCTLSVMELNYQIPPHTDSDIEAIINFYIRTDRCITQFYYPSTNPQAIAEGVSTQTDGAVFHEGHLKKSVRFMAHPGDAYLLDVSKPHSDLPTEPRLTDPPCIRMQLLYKSFDEAVEMLQETGYLD